MRPLTKQTQDRTDEQTDDAVRIAIVGTGPRGISVLERIAAQVLGSHGGQRVTLWLIDAVELGAGRIWRTDQDRCFLMNTVAGEISMFSGPSDGTPCQPGAGLSFLDWLGTQDDPELSRITGDDYAPRFAYGRYLAYVYGCVLRSLNGDEVSETVEVAGRVTAVRETGDGYRLDVDQNSGPATLDVDAVVLTTGHARAELAPDQQALADAADRATVRYLGGDAAADLELTSVSPRSTVGVIGLGLSFYDILMSFTIGRGGEFKETSDGATCYVSSGREPKVVAGSRSGLPIRSRGRNQKSVRGRSGPRFLTSAAVGRLREHNFRRRGTPLLDFKRDVFPLLEADVTYVYYTTQAVAQYGDERAEELGAELRAVARDEWQGIAERYGLRDARPLDLGGLSRPLRPLRFDTPAELWTEIRRVLEVDIAEAEQGNVGGALKAAVDMIRDSREVLRHAVDFGGLAPESYRDDFLSNFASRMSALFTGPPLLRTTQLLALVDAGRLEIVGPEVMTGFDPAAERFFLESPHVRGSRHQVDTLIDSRIPVAGLVKNQDPLMRQLVEDRVATGFVHGNGDSAFATGALHITPAERRVVSPSGTPHKALYALGIPTERVCWFTQIGNGRPGVVTSFSRDAEVIALSVLRRAKADSRGGYRAARK